MKAFLLLQILCGFILFSITAHAQQRVIVMFKRNSEFIQAQRAYEHKDHKLWQSLKLQSFSLQHIERSLRHLQAFIIDMKDEQEIANWKANPAILFAEKEVFHPLPWPIKQRTAAREPHEFDGRTPWGISAVKAPQAWEKAKQGEGARVMVLDTGIDKDHPAIKANFEQGQDFTGRSSGNDFSDIVGHGTHVSGIIAGSIDSTGFSGVAPKAKLLMGRVCSNLGCSSAAIVSGINWAIDQKVDVVSMSLGGPWGTASEQAAVKKAHDAGVSIVAASGNDGTDRVSFPAAYPTVVAVGAVDSTLARAAFSQYGPELSLVAPGVGVLSSVPRGTGREADVSIDEGQGNIRVAASSFQGARDVLTPETQELVAAGLGKPEDFVGKDVRGKYALVSRGEIAFGDKAKNALAAGALGIVIYNNVPGLMEGTLTTDGSVIGVYAFMIEKEVGERLLQKINAGQKVSATLKTLISDYMEYSGTSMATPHVSGVVALMKAANRGLSPDTVKNLLKTTAQALGPNDKNQYGAGLVNAQAAVEAASQAH